VRDSTQGSAAVAGERHLLRAIGRWGLTAAVINGVIGSGIFGLPAPVAALTGSGSPLAVLAAGAAIFVIVLCFAEVGSRFDSAGGPYLYVRETLGPAVGFQVGWLHVWTRLLSAAAVLNIFASYLALLLPWVATPMGRAVAITSAIALVTAINTTGVRQASWTVNVFTLAKLAPLVGLLVLGAFHFDPAVLATQQVAEPRWTEAILLLMFAFGGFESGVVAASETKNPTRDTAFALLAAMAVVTFIYCAVQLTVVGVLPNAREHPAPVSAALGHLLGPVGVTLGSIAVVISVYGWLTGFALMTPRIVFAMATRGELPARLASLNPRTRVPAVAIVLNSFIALTLGLVSDFGQLATFAAISRLGIYVATCIALIVLRRSRGPSPAFRAPAGPVLAVLGIVFCVWLLTTRSLAEAWFLPVMVLAGLAIWIVYGRSNTAP
jgi:APA family basic amino acid/polyamine antiporter